MSNLYQVFEIISKLSEVVKPASRKHFGVAIVGSPGPFSSCVAMACLKAQIPYIPIDVNYPPGRIIDIIKSVDALIVADDTVDPRLRNQLAAEYELVSLPQSLINSIEALGDEIRLPGTGRADSLNQTLWEVVQLEQAPDDVAYVIYTSGSTGSPKGIKIARRSLTNQLSWLERCGFLGKSVRMLQKTPIGFDAAQWELLAPLCGASVVGVPQGGYRDPELILDTINKYSITSVQLVPTLLNALLELPNLSSAQSLDAIYSGGEALSWKTVRNVRSSLPNVQVINLYGPSECTINASSYTIHPGNEIPDGGIVPIGVPVDNTEFLVLHDVGEEKDIGELLVSGAQLALEYVGLPEETSKKFIIHNGVRCYRTGDIVRKTAAGYEFVGRIDNQVKLNGNRVELDEVSARYDSHPWVSRAHCVVLDTEVGLSQPCLAAFLQLDQTAAPLMDGAGGGKHHKSKSSRLQVKSQLANLGIRSFPSSAERVRLCHLTSDFHDDMAEFAFARKTYRNFKGGKVRADDLKRILQALTRFTAPNPVPDIFAVNGSVLPRDEALARALLSISAFTDTDRLLPKYAYASPGSLYSIQTYVEVGRDSSSQTIPPGYFYYEPIEQVLVRASDKIPDHASAFLQLASKTSAIQNVYEKNVAEVQYFELGHYLGVLQPTLVNAGWNLLPDKRSEFVGAGDPALSEGMVDLGRFKIVTANESPEEHLAFVLPEVMLSIHKPVGLDLEPGLYKPDPTSSSNWIRISDRPIQCAEVIAINQPVYHNTQFGIAFYLDNIPQNDVPWCYASLGGLLQYLESAFEDLGFMSSGYSSFSGNPLPFARAFEPIVRSFGGEAKGRLASYFALGGRITPEQRRHRGMDEDVIHMKGPAEIINDELRNYVPDYMLPRFTFLVEDFPTTPNGKIDAKALLANEDVRSVVCPSSSKPVSTHTEELVATIWSRVLHIESVFADDNFFTVGGNSIRAMMVVSALKRDHGLAAAPQILFENPILRDFAAALDEERTSGRMLALAGQLASESPGPTSQVIMWPGLGGFPINLQPLAEELAKAMKNFEVFGIQAAGLNPGEHIVSTVNEMAIDDLQLLPENSPLHLVGYSFGCRPALAVSKLLDGLGRPPQSLTLLCPGNPTLGHGIVQHGNRDSGLDNPEFIGMLLSVFEAPLNLTDFRELTSKNVGIEEVINFLSRKYQSLDSGLISRIVRLVSKTYSYDYVFEELDGLSVDFPILLAKAEGDQSSTVDAFLRSGNRENVTYRELPATHYEVLKPPFVAELARMICSFMQSNNSVFAQKGL